MIVRVDSLQVKKNKFFTATETFCNLCIVSLYTTFIYWHIREKKSDNLISGRKLVNFPKCHSFSHSSIELCYNYV